MTKTQAKKISKLLESIDLDIWSDVLEELESYNELTDYLQENGYFDVEIIYYSRAMDYLHEHDTSLTTSLELAHDMGLTVENLNSETLASLLASENMREDYYQLESELSDILEEGE